MLTILRQEDRELLDQWDFTPASLRREILNEFNDGFTRIVPYKDGPFDKLGLSDGESVNYYSGEYTASFDALLKAAYAAHISDTSDRPQNVSYARLDVLIQDAQFAEYTAIQSEIDQYVLTYLKENEPSLIAQAKSSQCSRKFLNSTAFSQGVYRGLRFVAKTKLSNDGEPKEILNSNMGDPLPVIARIGRLLRDDLKQSTTQATTRPNKRTPK